MKITRNQLRRIIKEELEIVLSENRLNMQAVEDAFTMAVAERPPKLGLPVAATIEVVNKKLAEKLGEVPDENQVSRFLRKILMNQSELERLGIEKVDLGSKITRTRDGMTFRNKEAAGSV